MRIIIHSLTLSRIFFAIIMVIAEPFSGMFWICYLWGGLSDILDGFLARRLHLQSDIGAKLDSIADVFFNGALLFIVVANITFPLWMWGCIGIIVVIRLISYSVGFYKYHAFASLHTILNKITGVFLFVFPLFYTWIGVELTGFITCFIALLSAIEEMMITVKEKELNRDCKSIFHLHKK